MRTFKRTLCILLIAALAFSMIPFTAVSSAAAELGESKEESAPTGANQDVLQINDTYDLTEFADSVNNGNTYEGKTVVLNGDCTYSGDWTPIGTRDKPFKGTFYGNRHTITIKRCLTESDYTGLFGYSKGKITDLNVNIGKMSGADYVGGVAGHCYEIANCHVKGTAISGSSHVGGVVGFVDGEIFNCSNSCKVEGTQNYVGGITGLLR